MKIIFIASLSHSGSTLLDLMLNAHPEVASVGELKQLGRFARFEKKRKQQKKYRKQKKRRQQEEPLQHKCNCGAPSLMECDFWAGVSELTKVAVNRTIAELNVENYNDVASFDRDNVALFNAISAVSGANYVVDSSKDMRRLSRLIENKDNDVFPIFLVRDPKGQICSSLTNSASLTTLIARYVLTNREIYVLVKDRPHAVIHYEQLVQSPEPTLCSLMQKLGLAFDYRQLQWGTPVRHNVGGNRVRKRSSSILKLDDTWRHKLTISQKIAIDLLALPGRYGLLKYWGELARSGLRYRKCCKSGPARPKN